MSGKIDKEQWSKSSRSANCGSYFGQSLYYENIQYRCKKCSESCIFSAEAQKVAYEVRKIFVGYVPSLCISCQAELNKLRNQDAECQEAWNRSREELKENRAFLGKWLYIIKEIQVYGKRTNESAITMLTRRLMELPI